MNTQQGLHTVDVAEQASDINPYCEPLTWVERAILVVIFIASVVVVFGVSGYVFMRFNIA